MNEAKCNTANIKPDIQRYLIQEPQPLTMKGSPDNGE